MSAFEQMLAEMDVPMEIARQMSVGAVNTEVAALWERLAPAVDETFEDASTAAGVCAIAMLVAYIGEKLAANVKFGVEGDDVGDTVHPNFCIMAIAVLALRTFEAASAEADKGDNHGNEKEGEEKGSEEKGGEENNH